MQEFASNLSGLEYEEDPDYALLLTLLDSLLTELGVQVRPGSQQNIDLPC